MNKEISDIKMFYLIESVQRNVTRPFSQDTTFGTNLFKIVLKKKKCNAWVSDLA